MLGVCTKKTVLMFNFMPATYTDASWYEAAPAVRTRLAQLHSVGAKRALSDWLLRRYDLVACTDFDLTTPPDKVLCLREPAWLRRLAALIGLLRYRDSLRRSIGGGTLRRIGEELGGQVVQQALVRWPAPEFLQAPEKDIDTSAQRLEPQLLASGARWLFGVLDASGRAVSARVRFKFERALAEQEPILVDDEARAAGLDYLKAHVLGGGPIWQ